MSNITFWCLAKNIDNKSWFIVNIIHVIFINTYFKLYKKNLIEILANKAGKQTQRQYDKEGKEIRKAFPHIPPEML